MCAAYTHDMFGLIRRKRSKEELEREGEGGALGRREEPNPAVALAVGLIYVFRTAAGARIMRELEGAVRKYAADRRRCGSWCAMAARFRPHADVSQVIDTTAEPAKELPAERPSSAKDGVTTKE